MTRKQIIAASRALCILEWEDVNDPPCNPSDCGWQGCNTCIGRAIASLAAADAVQEKNDD